MHLKCNKRKKDGKVHRYWSVMESYRLANGRSAKRQVLNLGEINDGQKAAWCKMIDALEGNAKRPRQVALFPGDRQRPPATGATAERGVAGAGRSLAHGSAGSWWLALKLWELLELDEIFTPRLPPSGITRPSQSRADSALVIEPTPNELDPPHAGALESFQPLAHPTLLDCGPSLSTSDSSPPLKLMVELPADQPRPTIGKGSRDRQCRTHASPLAPPGFINRRVEVHHLVGNDRRQWRSRAAIAPR